MSGLDRSVHEAARGGRGASAARRRGILTACLCGLATAGLGGLAAAQEPAREAAERLATNLDRAFAAGSVDGYLQRFADRSWLPMILERRRLDRLLAAGTLRRRSRVVEVRRSDDRYVALLERTYECPDSGQRALSHAYLVFEVSPRPRARFEVSSERPRSSRIDARGVFTCRACNYRIGTADGWLAVEHAPLRTGCVETVSFYSLHHDLCVEVSVRFGATPIPARRALEELLERLATSLGVRAIGDVEAWTPPACRGPSALPPTMRGARVRASWRPAGAPRVVVLHLLTHGRLCYVLAAHGTETSLQRGGPALEELLATFELVDPDRTAEELDDLARRAHTGGGVLHGEAFHNEAHHVRFRGPAGWSAELRPGPWAFSVRYVCPHEGGVLEVTGYAPPPGFSRWTPWAADADLERLRRRAALEVVNDTGWQENAGVGPARRDVTLRPPGPERGPRELIVRLVRYGDLLVVATGRVLDDSAREVMRRALDSLARD